MLSDWNWEDAHLGYVESRREQVRQQEELVMKEKALRDTQIRSIHEMGELKRAQELRVDEFSLQEFRESHDSIQKLTSQIQELQERVNCMNDSGEFQDIESDYSENFPTFPVNQHSFQVLDLCYAATNACHLIHGIRLDRETFLAIHVLCSIHHRHLIKEFFTL